MSAIPSTLWHGQVQKETLTRVLRIRSLTFWHLHDNGDNETGGFFEPIFLFSLNFINLFQTSLNFIHLLLGNFPLETSGPCGAVAWLTPNVKYFCNKSCQAVRAIINRQATNKVLHTSDQVIVGQLKVKCVLLGLVSLFHLDKLTSPSSTHLDHYMNYNHFVPCKPNLISCLLITKSPHFSSYNIKRGPHFKVDNAQKKHNTWKGI